ncbi:MAG: hypothetical protein IJY09_06055 [Lachnospiraceae bacterium]|nr:hypothetical protein [Lachnospiraceae bacterium]
MATNQKKKSGSATSRSRNTNSKKSSSRSNNSRSSSRSGSSRSGNRGRGSQKSSSSGDGLSKVLLILFLGLLVVLLISGLLKNKKENEEKPTPTPTGQITAALTPTVAPTPEGMGDPTLAPSPTPTVAATPTLTPSPTPSPVATPTVPPAEPEAAITLDEAEAKMAEIVNVAGYDYELSDDHLWKDGRMYYCYVITYQQAEQYAILLDQESGEMYYYDAEGNKTPLEHFPMDSTEAPGQGENAGISEEKAVSWLSELSFTSLALPAPLAECEVSLDTWKTMVYGKECYCLNVFYQGTLAGTIYFTETAQSVYYLDEFGEFIRVR